MHDFFTYIRNLLGVMQADALTFRMIFILDELHNVIFLIKMNPALLRQ